MLNRGACYATKAKNNFCFGLTLRTCPHFALRGIVLSGGGAVVLSLRSREPPEVSACRSAALCPLRGSYSSARLHCMRRPARPRLRAAAFPHPRRHQSQRSAVSGDVGLIS